MRRHGPVIAQCTHHMEKTEAGRCGSTLTSYLVPFRSYRSVLFKCNSANFRQ